MPESSATSASPLDSFRSWADSLGPVKDAAVSGAQQLGGSAVEQFRSWADQLGAGAGALYEGKQAETRSYCEHLWKLGAGEEPGRLKATA
jgi:hypothetical protein